MTTYTNDVKGTSTIEYLISEALDYLMTEASEYLITNQSLVYTNDTKSASTYTNDTI